MKALVMQPGSEPAPLSARRLELTALVIDDNPLDRSHLAETCRKAGLTFAFTEVGDLLELRRALGRWSYDFIFIDHNLGLDTGLEALKMISSHDRQDDAIAIMVAGVGRHDIVVEAMRCGCADYIIKEELSVDSIRKSVTAAIERRLLLASLSRERTMRLAMKETVERFSRACAPEMRRILATMLGQLGTLRDEDRTRDEILEGSHELERSCDELAAFIEEIETIIEKGEPDSAKVVPLISHS
ncbi:response regulator [Pelagovum pacificum]|uniref:Response regulator n=1 Tax=Pelagovum pacificum TaxID=2588711 RepID=A0A5C5GCF5_9RHOB|nr:response regulator [Pelagovum pacificum]QQA42183.1 response regulator [Pelagovum pacificum]TNY31269.1 response regulator [Pelagovum pacificum]